MCPQNPADEPIMTNTSLTPNNTIMTADEMVTAIDTLAQAIGAAHAGADTVYLLGILSRGRPLAERLAGWIRSRKNIVINEEFPLLKH